MPATRTDFTVVASGDDPCTLVSTDWLATHSKDADLRILDATWYLPNSDRAGHVDYQRCHIPGTVFFDIDEIADLQSGQPHTVPPEEKFISRAQALGVGNGHQVVVYDSVGLFSAARVWWLFRLMGHTNVAVLDGGLPKWKAEGRAVTDKKSVVHNAHMAVSYQNEMVRDVTQVARASKLGDHTIIDARSADRFSGIAPEPRAGVRSGHIPGSRSVPYHMLLNANGTMKDPAGIKATFASAGVDLDKPAITTCGSGVTAAILSLALERVGKTDHSLYDGSWSEWGTYNDLPIETGAA